MSEAAICALIVDDEPPARAVIRRMLKEHADIEVVGECKNGREAIESLRKESPDLMFLDIQMPEMDGFELLEALSGNPVPAVIFVTAYDQYAVRAFEVAAVDYLLKPFDHERLETALQRARANLREKNSDDRTEQMLTLLEQLQAKTEHLERFVIKNNGRVLLVPVSDVDWIEVQGNYLRLHAGSSSYTIRETMNNLESRLDPRKFLRIHRSTMVNIDSVKEMQVHFNEEHLVILKDGSQLTLSRRFRDRVSQFLGAQI